MRKIYFVLAMLFVVSGVCGQLVTEPFNYVPDLTNGLYNQSAATWTRFNTGDSILVESGNLTYPGLATSTGNRVTYGGAGSDYYRDFASQTSGTVYYSLLLNVSSIGSLNATGGYTVGLIDGTVSSFVSRLFFRSSGANFNIGINAGSLAANLNWASNTLSTGTTYLVVVSHQINAGASNDVSKVWINPVSLGGSEPAADATSTNTGATDNATIQRIFLRQDAANATPGTIVIDEIRVGTTWAQVTPISGGTTATLANFTPQPSGSITQGTNDIVLSGFSITPTASIDFTAVTVSTGAGTATGTDITSVRVYRDNNANGLIDGADVSVSGAGVAYATSIPLTITGETGFSAVRNYLIVANVAGVGVSIPGNTAVGSIASGAFTTTATTNSGSAAGNLRTIAAPPGATTITAGPGTEPATISSLINTQGAAVLNFDFTIQDDGATPATDAVATQVSQIILNAGTGNTVTNWTTAILGVALSDGTNITTTATIGASSITFTGITNTVGTLGYIADDATKTYTLKIWLKTNLGALRNVIDGQNFVFRIQTADVSVTGSQLATGQDVNSGSTNNTVVVTATALAFVTQPSNTIVNAGMSNVTVSANDANGNRDLGSTVSVAITSTGTLSGSPVTIAAVSGLATFVGLTHSATGTALTLNAERSGTLDWDVASSTFNIIAAPIAAWDFTGPGNTAIFTATTFDANLVTTSGANTITRGATAGASTGTNSFRTTGFSNDGIATTNTDYFQVTLTPQPGFDLSLSAIDGFLNGTTSYAATPGASNQFAYSLDGTNFTLIGSPSLTLSPPVAIPTINLSGISALQNVPAGTTVTIRYYASGQTTTGGWGFYSSASGVNGLAIGGTIASSSSPNLLVSSGSVSFASQTVGTNSTSQSINLSGVNLTSPPASVTVTSSSTDFQVSNDDAAWGASTTINYGSATLTATPLYIRFTPQSPGPKSGNVTFSGGGDATPPTVTVTGSGVINYYSKATGNLTDVNTWGTATDGTGSLPVDFTTAGQTFIIANRATVTLDANWTVSGAGTKVVTGDGISATEFIIPAAAALTGTADVANLGKLTLQNTTLPTLGTMATGSTVNFAQTGTVVIPTWSWYNLILTGGTKTLASATSTVNGNLVIDGVTGFNGSATPFSTISLAGNFALQNGAAFEPIATGDANRLTLILSGSGTQTLSGGDFYLFRLQTPATPATTLNIPLSSANLFLGNANGGGLNLQQAAHTLSLAGNTLTVSGSGFFSVSNTGTITGSSTSNLVISKTVGTAPIGSVGFSGGAAQLNNLNYNSSSLTGNNSLTLNSPVSVAGALTLTNGNIISTSVNLLTLLSGGTLSGGSSASFISGPFARETNTAAAVTFPVGKATSYKPFVLTPASTDLSVFSGEYFATGTNTTSPACNPARLEAYINNEYWDVSRTTGIASAQVTLNYNQASAIGHWTDGTAVVADPDASKAITIAHYTGACWQDENLGTGILLGNAASGQVTSKAVSVFSPFTFGYGPLTVLPVNFGTVKASQQSNAIKVEWSNMTELEVVNYNVERSSDGRHFISLGQVNARLNNGSRTDYSFIDASPINGINYYRIVSMETTGRSKVSIVVKVDIRGGATLLVLYPNPVTDGQLSYQAVSLMKGLYTLRIFNSVGQQVYSKSLNHPGGSVTEVITLPSVKAGIYSLQLSSADNALLKTFVVP